MSNDRTPAAVLYAQAVNSGPGQDDRQIEEDLAVLRSVASRNDGRVSRTEGRRVQMVFGNSVRAVASALELQGIFTRSFTQDADKHNYRFGAHFGEVVLTGELVSGETPEIAARIQQLARPGTIWVSGAVLDGIKGKLPVIGAPKGFRVLKDLGKTVSVFELIQGLGPVERVAKKWKLSKTAPAWAGVV